MTSESQLGCEELNKYILTCVWKNKESYIINSILKKKSKGDSLYQILNILQGSTIKKHEELAQEQD